MEEIASWRRSEEIVEEIASWKRSILEELPEIASWRRSILEELPERRPRRRLDTRPRGSMRRVRSRARWASWWASPPPPRRNGRSPPPRCHPPTTTPPPPRHPPLRTQAIAERPSTSHARLPATRPETPPPQAELPRSAYNRRCLRSPWWRRRRRRRWASRWASSIRDDVLSPRWRPARPGSR